MNKWDFTQWGYFCVIALSLYFVCLAVVWLRNKHYAADPFFYYIMLLVCGIFYNRIVLAIARHKMLIGDIVGRDDFLVSPFFGAANIIPIILLSIINIHATYRYKLRK